jgi:hypothetical protein
MQKKWLGLHCGRFFRKLIWSPCPGHSFGRFLGAIFGDFFANSSGHSVQQDILQNCATANATVGRVSLSRYLVSKRLKQGCQIFID